MTVSLRVSNYARNTERQMDEETERLLKFLTKPSKQLLKACLSIVLSNKQSRHGQETDKWRNGWTDRLMDQRTDRPMNRHSYRNARMHLKTQAV